MLAGCTNVHEFQRLWKRRKDAGMMHDLDAVAGLPATGIGCTAQQDNGLDDST